MEEEDENVMTANNKPNAQRNDWIMDGSYFLSK
jgi:hypothetical protein